ncbi:D-alanyl-lipoteichoic acid biosynthesis protein DltB [Fructobacillus sp. M1-13]|uniref:Teichoic acid D-alanyltransferase n=1 Tax=Fructobacillus papyriferae TaxID=2713171 RepID=A0ABS5QSE5_9LACO|nr:D-alanyl-lipoteichoic acid biosynthesis protein DltB [Fructobacillus papyriferae]MBS9335296.1 D-alanyl-lipoteichoic acid biosynthesis protein DltB [Fructobacillus papyriferae]MCD2159035.1 D-alanyl-lipoteichoic acid biosynthesis protein DltB [Fructobacillus papyriferae]
MPNLQPYADPNYFIYLLLALVPLSIGLYFGKRFVTYEILVSLAFIFLIFDEGHYVNQGVALIIYSIWQFLLVWGYISYRKKANASWVFYLATALSILPIFLVRLAGAGLFHAQLSMLGFLGISYLTFRSVGMIIETRDGAAHDFHPIMFLRFMLFMPTLSSGPIDRYTRFAKDAAVAPEREKYIDLLGKAVKNLFLGFVYKFILSYYFGQIIYPYFQGMAMSDAHHGMVLSWWLIPVAYSYGMYLFFDFAGYSLFALAISYIMGIESPINFNKPYGAKNIKEFWNRWHMSLSFWFRDFVFMRFVFLFLKKKWIKNRNTVSTLAYFVNMLVMGFWHGLTWYYILYGFMHGAALAGNDAWIRFKRKHKGRIPHNKWTEGFAVVLTFHFVMLTFLVFCGFLDTFWFHR